MSLRDIAKEVGVGYSAVRRLRIELGLEPRTVAALPQITPAILDKMVPVPGGVDRKAPEDILYEIANNPRSPATARVAACRALMGLSKASPAIKAQVKSDEALARALTLIRGGRSI
jgi:hypothetical protein